MKVEVYKGEEGNFNLHNYEKQYNNFDWKEVEKAFSWYDTGKINMAHECIDRHVDEGKGEKVALHYKDDKRQESFTFNEMKSKSNKAANVLKDKGNVEKGDRVFIFMPRTPELYFALFGILKIGAIVGPLFEAFMEKAVGDRLENSEVAEGRIFILRNNQHIVGYVTYHYPDPLERWSSGNLAYLIELGAIEISLPYRHLHLGSELIKISLAADEYEDYIVLTTEYYWHWDFKNSGLDVFEYKKLMQKLMGYGGLEIFATDDPEITSHPANCLMARIGSRITIEQLQAFDDIRYMNRFFF